MVHDNNTRRCFIDCVFSISIMMRNRKSFSHLLTQEVYKLINSLAWSKTCRCKKKKRVSVEHTKFRAACNRGSRIYDQAALLRSCAGLREVPIDTVEKCKVQTDNDLQKIKELLVAIDYWAARSFMCVKCEASVVKRRYCECHLNAL